MSPFYRVILRASLAEVRQLNNRRGYQIYWNGHFVAFYNSRVRACTEMYRILPSTPSVMNGLDL